MTTPKRPRKLSDSPLRPAVDVASVAEARMRLLIAAERLLVRGGLPAVSLRRIASEASAHPALIAYYFGSLPGLLKALAEANMDVMLASRAELLAQAQALPDDARRLDRLIDAYVRPFLCASAFGQDERASAVVRNLFNGEDANLRECMVERIGQDIKVAAQTIGPYLPHLSKTALMLRLRLLTGAAVYMLPKIDELGIFNVDKRIHPSVEQVYQELLVFARGALLAPSES